VSFECFAIASLERTPWTMRLILFRFPTINQSRKMKRIRRSARKPASSLNIVRNIVLAYKALYKRNRIREMMRRIRATRSDHSRLDRRKGKFARVLPLHTLLLLLLCNRESRADDATDPFLISDVTINHQSRKIEGTRRRCGGATSVRSSTGAIYVIKDSRFRPPEFYFPSETRLLL